MNSLISTQSLAEALGSPDLIILDAARHLPTAKREDTALYDGSWLEWGGDAHTPKAVHTDGV